ncbi:hypothetical protein GCM10020221_29460 [Streptomyces thioluteus]|uniref:Uncharacterized protein n=2 Tax=Streptomyces TaxID=1883 RepID=A0A7W8BBR9_STREU|nr:hypothetical protein [Streptomyces eurocidicus]MBB5120465.1 hypothetical protein [Streptomyces eurocidicus]
MPRTVLPTVLGTLITRSTPCCLFPAYASSIPPERTALDHGVTVRRGQGYTLRVTAVPPVHRRLLERCQPLDGAAAIPAQRKARREYVNRVNALSNGT